MGGTGHVQTLLPLVQGLCERGCSVHVMTHVEFRDTVEQLNASFVDLYARYPMDAADATSIPIPSRYVSFAGMYAGSLADDVARLEAALVVHDTYAVVGPVVARRLGLPFVTVSPNHALVPSRAVATLRDDPRVATSPECWAGVARLRDVFGLAGANPFSYVETISPFLNLYVEPPEFLLEHDRAIADPIGFFSSLMPRSSDRPVANVFPQSPRRLRIYVSFGTVVWWYFAAAAQAALSVIARTCAGRDVDVVISLGGHALDQATRLALERSNVRVLDYVDQRGVLEQADLFITHHGLNSTHEAIFHEVPMLSYPFFGDQPALARRCQELGLAVPLASVPRGALDPTALDFGIAHVAGDRAGFASRLAEARSWELRTIANRDAVVDRVIGLAGDQTIETGGG
jgi:MGT family glycosyltransferase